MEVHEETIELLESLESLIPSDFNQSVFPILNLKPTPHDLILPIFSGAFFNRRHDGEVLSGTNVSLEPKLR